MTTGEGLDESPPPAAPAGRDPHVRRVEAVLLLMVLLGLAAWFGVPWYRDRSYIGTTASVILEWRCSGWVAWTDTDRNVKWDSVGDIGTVQRDALDGTAAGTYNGQRVHRARGTMEFTSYTDAVFVSSSGATIRFVRHAESQFSRLACVIT